MLLYIIIIIHVKGYKVLKRGAEEKAKRQKDMCNMNVEGRFMDFKKDNRGFGG